MVHEQAMSNQHSPTANTMAMLPNDKHPGPGCSCADCLRAYPEQPSSKQKPAWLAIGWGEGTADMRIVRNAREMVQWLWEQCGPDHTGNEESTRNYWYAYLEDFDNWTHMDGLQRWHCNIDVGETGHIEFQALHGDALRLAAEPSDGPFEVYFTPSTGVRGVLDDVNDVKIQVHGQFESEDDWRNYCARIASMLNRAVSVSGMGAAVPAVAAGDGRNNSFSKDKAGPAEVPVSAGNVPATGHESFSVLSLPVGGSANTGPVAGREKPQGEPAKPEDRDADLPTAVCITPDRLSVPNNRRRQGSGEFPMHPDYEPDQEWMNAPLGASEPPSALLAILREAEKDMRSGVIRQQTLNDAARVLAETKDEPHG